jgi:hypothetical protein
VALEVDNRVPEEEAVLFLSVEMEAKERAFGVTTQKIKKRISVTVKV